MIAGGSLSLGRGVGKVYKERPTDGVGRGKKCIGFEGWPGGTGKSSCGSRIGRPESTKKCIRYRGWSEK